MKAEKKKKKKRQPIPMTLKEVRVDLRRLVDDVRQNADQVQSAFPVLADTLRSESLWTERSIQDFNKQGALITMGTLAGLSLAARCLDIQVRLLIPAKEMVSGRHYKLRTGEIVEFSRVGATGRYIVHPPGEPDMQSSTALHPDEFVEEVATSIGK